MNKTIQIIAKFRKISYGYLPLDQIFTPWIPVRDILDDMLQFEPDDKLTCRNKEYLSNQI